ncbi:hypothetical protein E7T09_20935 [Deinococcus sp. KSM4-11]|uniref:hypothetical protein n=1 Tax=Deinococcus sp. KSM4-11 TaxID=2568654 RepID=UPI0010A506B6|nr:hypothetical protein [Deinococcus sp. KSM4-11]THF83978.1 hypothetical protein E7T09_20935 [Deinococcus sp. KSM4-11]
MGVREQFASVAAYGLVALASAMVVSGGTLSEAVRSAFHPPEPVAVQSATAVAGARVSAAAGTAVRPATGTTASSTRPATADVLPATLPDIPGADAEGSIPTIAAAIPRAPLSARPAVRAASVSETGSAQLDATLRLARWLTQQWYDSSLQTVWAAFSPKVKAQWKSYGDFQSFRAGGKRAYGAETAVLAEELTPHGTVTYYTRTASYERGPKDGWTLIIGLDASGQVQDFGVVGASLLPARMNNLMQ